MQPEAGGSTLAGDAAMLAACESGDVYAKSR